MMRYDSNIINLIIIHLNESSIQWGEEEDVIRINMICFQIVRVFYRARNEVGFWAMEPVFHEQPISRSGHRPLTLLSQSFVLVHGTARMLRSTQTVLYFKYTFFSNEGCYYTYYIANFSLLLS